MCPQWDREYGKTCAENAPLKRATVTAMINKHHLDLIIIGGVWGPVITGAVSDKFGIACALQVVVLLSVCLV